MADNKYKRLIYSWWTVLLLKTRTICEEGGIPIETIP